jgi:dCTP deaminase
MAILTGHEIRKQVAIGGITISPYDESRVQPNSIDLTLGTGVCVYASVTKLGPTSKERHHLNSREFSEALELHPGELDPRRQNDTYPFQLDESGWLLKPGILYLMHVVEELCAPNYVMTLDGKSSYGRLGIIVHFTAGHAETGFWGQYTMEVSAIHPVRIYPGMPIAQVIFTTIEGEREDYKKRGNYVGEAAMGAQPSRSWRHFK